MKYVDEFRDGKLIARLAREIRESVEEARTYNLMEVCGTHTMAIFRFGLKTILPSNINLISGPGCPVCVTPNEFIDKAIALSRRKDIIIATFGDMLKVPGSYSNLEKERAGGSSVKMVYSSIDALDLAKRNPDKDVVFLGIGFETTAPTVAQSILMAKKEGLKNYSVLCGHKTMPEALNVMTDDPKLDIDAFLLPGHVSAIIGVKPYAFLAKRGKRCVVAGFEPLDIMQAILMLIKQKRPGVEIQYTRIIRRGGNALAKNSIKKVFEEKASVWRGIGKIRNSGLEIRDEFSGFDAAKKFRVKGQGSPAHEAKGGAGRDPAGCICGDVIKGVRTPPECKLFRKTCAPDHPVGACMVSSEGTCSAYYKYG